MNTNRTNRTILAFSATAIFIAASALAQVQPGAPQQQQNMPMQQQQQPVQNPNMPGDTAVNPVNGASFADQAFVRQIFESDAAEVQLGQLAAQKSQSPDVKQLAQSIADTRTKLDQQLMPIAKKLDVNKPKEPAKKDREMIARLEGMSGTQFDEEYIKAVAKGNQKDVKDFNAEAQSAQDPTLLQAAKQDAGVLAQHQQVVQQVAQTHNVDVEAKN